MPTQADKLHPGASKQERQQAISKCIEEEMHNPGGRSREQIIAM